MKRIILNLEKLRKARASPQDYNDPGMKSALSTLSMFEEKGTVNYNRFAFRMIGRVGTGLFEPVLNRLKHDGTIERIEE